MDNKARVILRRSSEWVNRARGLKVMIDGQQAGSIRNGSTEDFKVEPGTHKIFCKVDWCSSRELEFNAAAGEAVYLFVRSGMKYYWQVALPLLAVVLLNMYYIFSVGVRPTWLNYLLIIVALPACIYFFYYTTFGRKDYLVIRKDDKAGFGS